MDWNSLAQRFVEAFMAAAVFAAVGITLIHLL